MNKTNDIELTYEEMLQDASLSEIHSFIRKAQTLPPSQLIPQKHNRVLTSITAYKTRSLFFSNPSMPIKKVITTIFEDLTDDIPAPLMLKLTKKIIAQWELLSAESQKTGGVAVTA